MRSIKWHERNIIKAATVVANCHKQATSVEATVMATELLTQAVDRYKEYLYQSKIRQRHEDRV